MAVSRDDLLFHWSDYLVFILSLILSGSVGVVQGIVDAVRNKKKAPPPQQLQGDGDGEIDISAERNISAWPASLSVMASTLAAPFVLGVPTELYAGGVEFAFIVVGYAVGLPIVTHLFFTRFYDLEITSIYEYLEFRFSKSVRSLCTFIFAFTIIVYMGIITYAPAVAFSQVTGLSVAVSILGVGLIGIVYTTVGGLKGVIWVDAIQMLIILASVIAIIAKGTTDVGGLGVVMQRAADGGRLNFDRANIFTLNPLARHTFWTQTVGGSVLLIVVFTNQSIVQKFLGLRTRKQMIVTSYVSMLAIVSYILLFAFTGLVIYAYYHDCSPLLTGKIRQLDQLLPVFVLEIFHGMYGFAGLFTAAVFSASLSSMAGGINALAAVTILDVINPMYTKRTGRKQIAPRKMVFLFKGLVIVYGFITIGFAYLAPFLGRGLLQLAINLFGVIGAPMLALFFIGIFMPCVNAIGATVGLLVSIVMMIGLSFGGMYVTGKYQLHIRGMLPMNKSCPAETAAAAAVAAARQLGQLADNVTDYVTTLTDVTMTDVTQATSNVTAPAGGPAMMLGNPTTLESFYLVSYMWYYVIAIVITIVVALLVSWCTGFRRGLPVNDKLSYACCYKKQDEEPLTEDAKLEVGRQSLIRGSVNEGATVEPPTTVIGLGPFGEIDDSGVYNFGFVRDRCSRCRRSRVVQCTRF